MGKRQSYKTVREVFEIVEGGWVNLICGDNLVEMRKMPDNSVDSIVTDPPYGLAFMGKDWDSFRATRQTKNQVITFLGAGMRSQTHEELINFQIWCIEWAKECLRVLKPGGYLLSFGGTRTCHRLTCAIEDAGFEIRDMICWIYGSGFPKSHNIHKANPNCPEGWGTALKPALEPITMARKPLSEKTVALNVLKWGTGGINIDGCRVEYQNKGDMQIAKNKSNGNTYLNGNNRTNNFDENKGRFPANLIHDGSQQALDLFPNSKSTIDNTKHSGKSGTSLFAGDIQVERIQRGDFGSAARFFYCPKASKKDRNDGCENIEEKQYSHDGREKPIENAYQRNKSVSKNNHPTVKPTKLMQYLVRLVTPKNGIVLDPFMGSGSTGKACKLEGFDFIGIEMDEEYCKIAKARVGACIKLNNML